MVLCGQGEQWEIDGEEGMDGLLVTYGTEMDDFNPVSQVRFCQACSSRVVPASLGGWWKIFCRFLQSSTTAVPALPFQCFISVTPQQTAFHCFSNI